jgi:uncharacterized membrane protein YbhN (UPF0104 family)
MKMQISKWSIFKGFLFILFFPFLAFDIFLFYDDGAGDFETIGRLWLITFLISLIFYLYKRRLTTEKAMLRKMAELVFFSFAVLFFIANFFLVGLFLLIMHTNNQFLF